MREKRTDARNATHARKAGSKDAEVEAPLGLQTEHEISDISLPTQRVSATVTDTNTVLAEQVEVVDTEEAVIGDDELAQASEKESSTTLESVGLFVPNVDAVLDDGEGEVGLQDPHPLTNGVSDIRIESELKDSVTEPVPASPTEEPANEKK